MYRTPCATATASIRFANVSPAAAKEVFAGWQVVVRTSGESEADGVVTLQARAVGALGPPPRAIHRYLDGEKCWVLPVEGIFYYQKIDRSSELLVNLKNRTAFVAGRTTEEHLECAFSLLLGASLAERDIAFVKAAAVGDGRQGALVLGETRRGKSSLVSQFLAAVPQSRVVGDDLIVARGVGTVEVAVVRSVIGIAEGSGEELGTHVRTTDDGNGRTREWYEIPPERLAGSSEWLPIEVVWLPTVWHSEASLVRAANQGEIAEQLELALQPALAFLEGDQYATLRDAFGRLAEQSFEILMGSRRESLHAALRSCWRELRRDLPALPHLTKGVS